MLNAKLISGLAGGSRRGRLGSRFGTGDTEVLAAKSRRCFQAEIGAVRSTALPGRGEEDRIKVNQGGSKPKKTFRDARQWGNVRREK